MEALRIILTQSSANYKREETLDNKMTYPLPPVSTIIGALHYACGYKEYHDMDISIQGSYQSMHNEPYTDYCFLNSVMDDRGILVKMKNGDLLSSAFTKVASAKKSQGNSFRKGITIQVYNEELLKEYRRLKDLKDNIDKYKKGEYTEKLSEIKLEKKQLADKKKKLDKKSDEYKKIYEKEKEIKAKEKKIKEDQKKFELENYEDPISKFKSLTTSLKYYEILDDIELIIHVKSDKETLKDIEENIYNLKSIGRSEDIVDIKDVKLVSLKKDSQCDVESDYSAYLNYDDIKNYNVLLCKLEAGSKFSGTKYYLNKNYEIKDKKRCFVKKKVIYASQYSIEKTSENTYIDDDGKKDYIVNFI